MAIATLARLQMSPALNLQVVRTHTAHFNPANAYAHTVECSPLEFSVRRRQIAEEHATTPIYLVADDDILPFDNDWVEQGLAVMERNPDYLAAMYRPIGVDFSKHTWGGNEEIEEYSESSGLWFMRRGAVAEWPTAYTEDVKWNANWESKIIRKQGGKVGIFKRLGCNHLGLGFSTLFWNANGYGPVPIP